MCVAVIILKLFSFGKLTVAFFPSALTELSHSMKVYATVVATNALGLNASATSQPIAVDNTPPVAGTVVELSDKYFIVAGDDNATAAANVYTCDTAEGR